MNMETNNTITEEWNHNDDDSLEEEESLGIDTSVVNDDTSSFEDIDFHQSNSSHNPDKFTIDDDIYQIKENNMGDYING